MFIAEAHIGCPYLAGIVALCIVADYAVVHGLGVDSFFILAEAHALTHFRLEGTVDGSSCLAVDGGECTLWIDDKETFLVTGWPYGGR